MKRSLIICSVFSVLLVLLNSFPVHAMPDNSHHQNRPTPKSPIVIAHRGASGYMPEHTLAAYSIAILQGADFIEPDLVMTKDGHLIARHDNFLDLTTDVADRPEFKQYKTTRQVDGVLVKGWFSEDFTLAEIKQLRAIERIPDIRPENTRFNGMFEIPTLEEIIQQVKGYEQLLGKTIGIYPETKHPSHFQQLGLPMEKPLVEILHRAGYSGPDAAVYIQSFEVSNLKALNKLTDLPLIQLLSQKGQPQDVVMEGGALSYDEMATRNGLLDIAKYADGVGPEKYHFIIPKDSDGNLKKENTTGFVDFSHLAGLKVHAFTFRNENVFLPANFQNVESDNTHEQLIEELLLFLEAGIDGFFVDQTELGIEAKRRFLERR
ncbi:MAG: glycerophosphodiester phosphodiesterase [Pseudomonadales bacterium]|nr:glycerophosphodiester phosphodiesterase [Pseudomonadales bacterium]